MTQLTRGLTPGAVGNGGLLLPGKSIQTPSRWSVGGSRTQVLYNRGEFFLSILPNGTIKPSVDRSNIFAVLQLYTVAASVVAIQARMTGYFLCMNYLSQLYTSKNYTDDCAFYEKLLKQYYTTFYSSRYKRERNQTWYISIDRRGRPRKGARSNEHQWRVQFLPLDPDLVLIEQIEHEQRTKTGSNTSATTSIDAIRTVRPLLSSTSPLWVTTPGPPPLPDIPRCSGTQCRKRDGGRRRRRRCKGRSKEERKKCMKKRRRRRRRRRRNRNRKKHSDVSVVTGKGEEEGVGEQTTRLQIPETSMFHQRKGGGGGAWRSEGGERRRRREDVNEGEESRKSEGEGGGEGGAGEMEGSRGVTISAFPNY